MTIFENSEVSDYFILKTNSLLLKMIAEQKNARRSKRTSLNQSFNECKMLMDKTQGMYASKRSSWLKRQELYAIPEDTTEERVPPLHDATNKTSQEVLPQQRVKLTLYQSSTPYLVIVNPESKYGKPLLYIKLQKCKVSRVNSLEFKLITNVAGCNEATNATEEIHLKSLSLESTDKWMQLLSPSSSNNKSTRRRTRVLSNKLPSLQEENDEPISESSSNLKSPVRKISRIARRNSFKNTIVASS